MSDRVKRILLIFLVVSSLVCMALLIKMSLYDYVDIDRKRLEPVDLYGRWLLIESPDIDEGSILEIGPGGRAAIYRNDRFFIDKWRFIIPDLLIFTFREKGDSLAIQRDYEFTVDSLSPNKNALYLRDYNKLYYFIREF